MEFNSKQALTSFLANRISQNGIPDEIGLKVAQDLLPMFDEPRARGKGFRRIFAKRWVIRDDDLKLVDFICSSLTVGALAVTGGPVLAVGAASVTALVKLIYALVKKGAKITPTQNRILLGLKIDSQGRRINDLVEWLRDSYGVEDWSVPKVEAELTVLQSIPLNDGNVVALVTEDSGNRWHAAGV